MIEGKRERSTDVRRNEKYSSSWREKWGEERV